ncbi:arabinofuranosidase [Clavulina sp. PMI_390]|nr:arabinofuranosidase [Clavulina sp. PMI_390]
MLSVLALASWLTAIAPITTYAKVYRNPILPGFHPDPSCTFVPEWNDTFFCATSSFNAAPGIPIFASKDLQNFKQIGNVLTRDFQLPGLATTNGSTSGIWAPTIRYHDDTFFLVTTLVYDNRTANDTSRWFNTIFNTVNPYDSSLWSDAVYFEFEGYDTSPFWDEQGNAYIVGSHAWKIYEAILGFQIELNTGARLSPMYDLWNGTDPGQTDGIAPEAPHLFQRPDGYYLSIAQGGTGLGHMVNFARSPTLFGQYYEGDPHNPVLSNANTTDYFQTVGHADFFQDARGNWWAVALATRSGPEYKYYPMGRETTLTPAQWLNGSFPTAKNVSLYEDGTLPPVDLSVPGDGYWVASPIEALTFPAGSSLPNHFIHQRWPDPSAYITGASILGHKNALALIPSVLNLTGHDAATAPTPQTFVGRRQEHIEFVFSVAMSFASAVDGAEAGITIFVNQARHFDLGVVSLSPSSAAAAGYTGTPVNTTSTSRYIRLRTITANSTNAGASDPYSHPAILPLPPSANLSDPIRLEVTAVNYTTYKFSYASGTTPIATSWTTVGWSNSSQVSGGYMGTIAGVFATGNGANVTTPAYFWDWSYIANDLVW